MMMYQVGHLDECSWPIIEIVLNGSGVDKWCMYQAA